MFDVCVEFSLRYALIGAAGGLAHLLLQPGGLLELPKIVDGKVKKVSLGFLRTVVVGAIAGCVGDKTPTNAFVWGLAGQSVLGWIETYVERMVSSGGIAKRTT